MSTNESAPQVPAASEPFVFSLPGEAESLRDRALWAGLLVLLTIVTYMPATNGKFIWDDERHVSQNRNLLTTDGLVNIWTKFGLKNDGAPQYYPLTHTTFWLEYRVWQLDPTWYHVTNILIQAISAVLLWMILARLQVPGAWVAAAIFAIHPVQVESVAWISERKNLLAVVFYFGAMLAWMESGIGFRASGVGSESAEGKPDAIRWNFYVLSFALFVCALLSKTIACSMPAVMVLVLLWKNRRIDGRQIVLLLPFFVVGAGLGMFTAHLERTQVGATGPEWDSLTFADRTLVAGRALWFYVQKIFWPANQAFIYPRWDMTQPPSWWWAFPTGFVAVVLALLVIRRRSTVSAAVLLMIYAGVLFPALGFFNVYPMRYSFVADHFQYPAGTAIFILAVVIGAMVLDRATKNMPANARATATAAATVPVLLVLAAVSWSRAHVFENREVLWRDTLAKNPDSWMAHTNLGSALLDQSTENRVAARQENNPELLETSKKQLDEAMAEFQTSLKIKPDNERAHRSLGLAYVALGQFDKALPHTEAAIRLRPDFTDAYRDRARILIDLHRYDDALAALDEVKKLTPSWPQLYTLYSMVYERKGDLDRAIAMDRESVKLRDSAEVRYHLAGLLHRAGKPVESIGELQQVLKLDPNYAPAWAMLGFIAGEQNDFRLAYEMFQRALAIDPESKSAQEGMKMLSQLKPVTRPTTTTAPSTSPSTAAPATPVFPPANATHPAQ